MMFRFLLVVLYLESLKDLISIRQIRQALEQAKKATFGLSKMYDNAVARIQAQDDFNREVALEILCWVANAKRPLKIRELQHALAIRKGDTDIDNDGLVDDESYFVAVCDGLVIIDNESETVRLIHHTLLEYLSLDEGGRFFPCPQAKIANMCLTYLLFNEFSSGFLPDDEQLENRLKNYPLLEYAAKYWGEHYRVSGKGTSETVILPDRKAERVTEGVQSLLDQTNMLVDKFLKHDKNVSCAVQVMQLPIERIAGYSQHPPQKVTTLWLVASFGLVDLVQQQLAKEGIIVDEKTSNEETALYAAVCREHYVVVNILLEAGSDPRIPGGEFGNALQAASAMGFENMIPLLLTHGADINCQCGMYGTALQAAAAHGHEDIVSLLIEHGADVNAQAGWYGTALRAASANGYETVVQALLDAGADLEPKLVGNNTPTASNTSALSDATAAGSESIVRLLLVHGADANGLDDGSGELRPLHKAVQSGNLTMVTLLLERGADLSANSREGTALHLAASFGDAPMVQLLLEFGAEIEVHDPQSRTPLLVAAEETDTAAVAEKLLADGANPETRDIDDSTALIVAATCGHENIVRKLVEYGSNIQAKNTHWTTPLLAAAKNGHSSIVRFLLDKGADPELQDVEGANALITAANNKHPAVVDLLLQHDAKFTRNIWESSALTNEGQGILEKVVVKSLLKSPAKGRDNWEFLQVLWDKQHKSQAKEARSVTEPGGDDIDVSALKALGGGFWQTEPAEYSKHVEVDSDN
jgi:ankyrin repeat protein